MGGGKALITIIPAIAKKILQMTLVKRQDLDSLTLQSVQLSCHLMHKHPVTNEERLMTFLGSNCIDR